MRWFPDGSVADRKPGEGATVPQSHTVQVPGFVLRLGEHPGGSEIARHYHDDPTICYVLRGRFHRVLPR